jgi:hypothetical protein
MMWGDYDIPIARIERDPWDNEPIQDEYCVKCDLDLHICPGCGIPLDHSEIACAPCNEEYED